MVVAIIGVGLIGGSIAIDLKKRGFARTIIGVENNSLHIELANQRKLVDNFESLDDAIEKADIIIIATPINVTKEILPNILDRISNKVVVDMGSTKAGIVELVKDHPKRKFFVASHPMAGTEYSGPTAAKPNLFDDKAVILCDVDDSDLHGLDLVRRMYVALNMKIIYMNSKEHDISAAYVSHISHISSFALALTVLEKEKNEKNILNLASGGFDSTVRLAKSSADMWTPVFEQNAENVIEVIDTFIDNLNKFRKHISDNNLADVYELIKNSNKIQKILE